MITVKRTFTVNPPPRVAHSYLQDFGHAETWDPGTISCDRIDNDRPIQVGSSWHNVSEFRGRRTKLLYRLARLEPDRLTFHGTNKTASSTDDITLAAAGDGTTITYVSEIQFHGLARLAKPILRRKVEHLGDITEQRMTTTLNMLPAEDP